MKKYLFGLGTMLVGAGLMFVLMHGEVSAEVKVKINDADCEPYTGLAGREAWGQQLTDEFNYCKIKDLTCVTSGEGISCVKS